LIIVNADFLSLLDNWMRISQQTDIKMIHCSLFLPIDQKSAEHISSLYSLPWMVRWYTRHNSEMQYGTKVYVNLMTSRLKLIRDLLLQGVNVAVLEVDQALLQNPFSIINALESMHEHDVITYDDSKDQRGRLPCFGFIFMRPTSSTVEAWTILIRKMENKQWQSYAGENEQSLLQRMLSSKLVTVRFLSRTEFQNGAQFGGTGNKFRAPSQPRNLSDVALVHANWVIGVQTKVDLLKYHGLWVLN